MNTFTARSSTQGAMHVASPWVEKLARLGYAAKGVVYMIVGLLAGQVALNTGGQTTGTRGALQVISNQPLGQFMLGIVALGLFGYAVWLFVRAFMDADNRGTDLMGLIKRSGYAITGILYLSFAYFALQLILAGRSDSSSVPQWTAWVMQETWGRWLIGIAGIAIVCVGFYRLYQSYSIRFRRRLNLRKMDSTERMWSIRVGRAGLASQGVVLLMIGSFFFQAAVQFNPNEARGLEGALDTIAQQPYGMWLLGIMAIGFIAHGFYMFLLARYRRIEPA